jgi:hypothetical protein
VVQEIDGKLKPEQEDFLKKKKKKKKKKKNDTSLRTIAYSKKV